MCSLCSYFYFCTGFFPDEHNVLKTEDSGDADSSDDRIYSERDSHKYRKRQRLHEDVETQKNRKKDSTEFIFDLLREHGPETVTVMVGFVLYGRVPVPRSNMLTVSRKEPFKRHVFNKISSYDCKPFSYTCGLCLQLCQIIL